MAKRTIIAASDAEALFLEQAKAMYQELNQTACDAPDGKVLQQAELCAVVRGRELIRNGLENVIQQQAQEVEKKGRQPEPADAKAPGHTAESENER